MREKDSRMRMIGPDDMPKITKGDFICMLGEYGKRVRANQIRYLRYVDRKFWFITVGFTDGHLMTEPGCALCWEPLTQDGKRVRVFEISDEKPIDETPLNDVVPKKSKLRDRSPKK